MENAARKLSAVTLLITPLTGWCLQLLSNNAASVVFAAVLAASSQYFFVPTARAPRESLLAGYPRARIMSKKKTTVHENS